MSFSGPIKDRLELRELLDAYADAVCQNNPDDWGLCWAKDGVWSMPDYEQFPDQTGRDNIVKMWIGAMAQFPGVIFVSTPGHMVIDGDKAEMRSYTSEVYELDGKVYRDRGYYEDECIREDGRWVFSKRVFKKTHQQIAT